MTIAELIEKYYLAVYPVGKPTEKKWLCHLGAARGRPYYASNSRVKADSVRDAVRGYFRVVISEYEKIMARPDKYLLKPRHADAITEWLLEAKQDTMGLL